MAGSTALAQAREAGVFTLAHEAEAAVHQACRVPRPPTMRNRVTEPARDSRSRSN